MSNITPTSRRIIPFITTIKAIGRSLWYLRTFLVILIVIILINSFLIYLFESELTSTSEVTPPKTYLEAVYLSVLTACTLSYSTLNVLSPISKIILIIDSFLGFVVIGIIVWVVQYCLNENKLNISKYVLLDTNEIAKLE